MIDLAEVPLKRLRCSTCGTKGEFPATFSEKEATQHCDVCSFHLNHDAAHDFRCAICTARLWKARLSAIRILLFYPAHLRVEGSQ